MEYIIKRFTNKPDFVAFQRTISDWLSRAGLVYDHTRDYGLTGSNALVSRILELEHRVFYKTPMMTVCSRIGMGEANGCDFYLVSFTFDGTWEHAAIFALEDEYAALTLKLTMN